MIYAGLAILALVVIGMLYSVVSVGTEDIDDDEEQIAYLREYNRRKADRKNKKQ